MTFEGGCYCGQVRYLAEGTPRLKAQCHCRECQYISGGAPNMFMLMPPERLPLRERDAQTFTRSDLDQPVTREFCENCGTHLDHARPDLPLVILRSERSTTRACSARPQMAIYTIDKQPFHMIPEGVPAFERDAAALVGEGLEPLRPSDHGRVQRAVAERAMRRALTLSIVTAAISRLRSTSHSGARRSSWIWTSWEAILAEVSKRSG